MTTRHSVTVCMISAIAIPATASSASGMHAMRSSSAAAAARADGKGKNHLNPSAACRGGGPSLTYEQLVAGIEALLKVGVRLLRQTKNESVHGADDGTASQSTPRAPQPS